jgi:predicted 2-oxoglutarate/Fe(II)-dependent dioxygenase YbiX
MIPGIRFFWDTDRKASALYGACDEDRGAAAQIAYQPQTFVLDPALRVLAILPLADVPDPFAPIREAMERLPRIGPPEQVRPQAPVLTVPRIFEPGFCRRLIDEYERNGGQDSGFMRDVEGKTISISDYGFKRRADHALTDQALKEQARARVLRRLVPEIHRAFQFRATRMERYIVACYEAEPGGYFRPHRDNTTAGTAHRRFAVTINLNAEEYEGGNLRFPEYGPYAYRAPTGGAVVFSCSLLHEALPVTKGRRFAFLPFLYDEEAARQREANNVHLGPSVGAYRAAFDRGEAPD